MIRRHPIVATVVGIPLVLTLTLSTLIALWLAGVPIPGASAARWFTLTKTANADYAPSPDKPVFLLAIGNDGRTGANDVMSAVEQAGTATSVSGLYDVSGAAAALRAAA